MILKIFLGIAALIVAFVFYASMRPDQFHVERSLRIAAPPEKLFALITDFHQWPQWSPYEHRDPAMGREYSGANSGKGAVYAWNGDKNVGQGRMEILEAEPNTKILIKLDFLKPFAAHNTATFTLVPDGGNTPANTTVTWAMDGPANLISKIMDVIIGMDKMVGTDFAAGLATLQAVAEK